MAGHAGVYLLVDHVLHLLGDGVVPGGAGEEEPEARLHDALDEVDGGAIELAGAEAVEVDVEARLGLDLVVFALVFGLDEPQALLGAVARDTQRRDALAALSFDEVQHPASGVIGEADHASSN